jgi:hypothetical protein
MVTEGSLEQPLTGWGLVKKGRHLSLLVDVSKDEALVILSQRRREIAERALRRPFLVPFSSWLSYQAAATAHLQTRGLPGLHEKIQNGQQGDALAWERVRSFSLAFLVWPGEGADLAGVLGAERRTRCCEPLGSCGWDEERVRRLVASGSSSA